MTSNQAQEGLSFARLWHRLTPIYEPREAQAVVRTLLEEEFSLSLTDIVGGALRQLTEAQIVLLQLKMHRLEQGEPVQYVIGWATFCGRDFHVTPAVLIPRPETEGLCRRIEADANAPYCGLQPPEPLRVFDIGTGSGCIATSLALDLWNAQVAACDISADALLVARDNAHRLNAKVDFRLTDALRLPTDDRDAWDIIVSNPPYIAENERAGMAKNVVDFEPPTALFVPDDDPLRFYRVIAGYATHALRPNGRLYFEINPRFADGLAAMLRAAGFGSVTLLKDDFGRQRYAIASR